MIHFLCLGSNNLLENLKSGSNNLLDYNLLSLNFFMKLFTSRSVIPCGLILAHAWTIPVSSDPESAGDILLGREL